MWLLSSLLACAVVSHPELPAYSPTATADEARVAHLAEPGPIEVESVVSARWEVPLHGLVDLSHPAAEGLEDGPTPIVLPVHVLTHPDRGVFVVDTGVTRDRAQGGHGPARGVVKRFLGDIEPVEPLGDILARQESPLGGVLLTHLHLDHVLGLPDVPPGTPIHAGPGELHDRDWRGPLMRPTYEAALDGHDPVRTWDFDAHGVRLGPVSAAIDVLGDGSLWALHSPGHTEGSTAYLARTTEGPVLFLGDVSHTRWGWDHGVPPGTYTADHDANAASLDALRALAAQIPGVRVFTGHELDGTGTGVEVVAAR